MQNKTNKGVQFSQGRNPLDFYLPVREKARPFNQPKPFSVHYDNPEHSVRLLQGDCVEILNHARKESVDMIFADPPYFLSNGGITCHAGKMVSVNKGKWDKSKGTKENHKFNLEWLKACKRVLKPHGTIWISGTTHIICSIGYALQELEYKILNDIIWYKRNAPPNLSCRYFTHSTETVLWATPGKTSKLKDHKCPKGDNVWDILSPPAGEKICGKHPTQKPLELLRRIVLASTGRGDIILDPFCGSSTTGVAAISLRRQYVGIDLDAQYLELSKKRLEAAFAPQESYASAN